MTAVGNGTPLPDLEADEAGIVLPIDEPSLLGEAVRRKELVCAPLGQSVGDLRIMKALKAELEKTAVAAPLIVNDKVLLVLYGDSVREGLSPRWREELELLLLQAGVSMEKALLQKRIEHYEHLRRESRSTPLAGEDALESQVSAGPR